MCEVSVPKRSWSLPQWLGFEDLQKLLRAAQRDRTARWGFHNYIMRSLLVFTGQCVRMPTD